jgi:hypothetical protein
MGTFCSLLELSSKRLLSSNSSSTSKSSISSNSSLSSIWIKINASSKFEFCSVYKGTFPTAASQSIVIIGLLDEATGNET